MRVWMLVLGVALLLTGTIWIVQGLGILKGSFMTGEAFWAWIGAVAVLVGLPLVLRALRRP